MLKNFLISLLSLVSVTCAEAQIMLVGAQNDTLGVTNVLRWNANTGTQQATVPTQSQGYVMGASVFDAVNGQYYIRDISSMHRVSFSPDTSDALNLQFDLGNAEIDMQTGKIFALTTTDRFDSSGMYIGSSLDFIQYNLANNTETNLLTITDAQGYIIDGSAYDSNHGTYYFVGVDTSQYYNLYKITHANTNPSFVKIPLINRQFMPSSMEYDNDNNVLYALGQLVDTLTTSVVHVQIQKIDTVTGAMTLDGDFSQFPGLQIGANTYDQATHTMAFIAEDTALGLWGYNTQSHTLTALQLPTYDLSELEADNTVYAAAKYGTVTQLTNQTSPLSFCAFPNPSTAYLYLRLPENIESTTFVVFDISGMQIANGTLTREADFRIEVQTLPAGLYFVRGIANGQLIEGKFTVGTR